MKRYHGGEKVHPGLYFNLTELAFASIDEAGCLPGKKAEEYRKVPVAALLIAGPILGAAYVVFLPVIGFAMLASVAGRKGLEIATHAVHSGVRVLEPTWEPRRAFLSRRKHAPKAGRHTDTWAEGVTRKLKDKSHKHGA